MKRAMRFLAISVGCQYLAGFLYITGLIMGGFASAYAMLALLVIAILLWLISISFGIAFVAKTLWGKEK